MRSRALVVVLCALLTGITLPGRSGAASEDPAGQGIETEHTDRPLAPGLGLTEFERLGPRGWVRGDALTADLSQPRLKPEYLHPMVIADRIPLSEQALRQHAIAGVNGDFFDIDATGAPLGLGISKGRLLNAPHPGHNQTVAIGDGMARLVRMFLAATLTRADGSKIRVSDLNSPDVAPGGIGLYTSAWGGVSRKSVVPAGQPTAEVEVVDGVVRRVSDAPAEGPVAGNAVRLLGTAAGADMLRSLHIGEHVDVRFRPRQREPAQAAISGDQVLLRHGVVQPVDAKELEPRTAVGFSADGKRMWLVTVDGRQPGSRGMSKRELGGLLKSFGAETALNLDGGGSSTLLAREPGEQAAGVRNHPSGGKQRPVPNGLGFTTAAGSGQLRAIRVQVDGRVFSGLSRRIRSIGHDEIGSPVPARPWWTVRGSGRVVNDLFHAGDPGASTLDAHSGEVSGQAPIQVLGPLAHLDNGPVQLPGSGATGGFQVSGQDSAGFRTWVEPSDVSLSYDPRLVRIRPRGDHFEVTALSPRPAVVTARVGGQVTYLPVNVGGATAAVPPGSELRDSSVVQDGTLTARARTNRVAVVRGAEIEADQPKGVRLHRARRALRDVRRAHPNMVVIDGDFVARGTSGDIALARRLIRSELGTHVRWSYVPGEGEANNPRGLRAFRAAFGPVNRVVDSRGTRYVMVDSSRGTLRASDFNQVKRLQDTLRRAAADPAVTSVAVFAHARSADPKESELLDRWFTHFEQVSGKPLVDVSGNDEGFRSEKVDGVQHEVAGDVAGDPRGAAARGGFTGTSLLRIAPRNHDVPIRWETRPFVDRLHLDVPDQVHIGQVVPAAASLGQDRRNVPVTYPVSADWSGSPAVHVGDPGGAKPCQIAAFDPRTGRLTGLRPGSGELSVVVNGVKRGVRFSVTP